MSGFWISEIRAYPNHGAPSTITLTQGLNVIAGPSNTGKTRVVRTIDFVMGGDLVPFTDDSDYCTAEIDLVTTEGEIITLRRSIGGDYVVSPQPGTEGKVYSVKRDDKDTETDLNSFLVSLLGFKPSRKVIKNSSWESQTLTWRSLYHLLYVPESYIDRLDSTILRRGGANDYVTRTAELSTLLVLAQDENFDDIEPQESDKDRRIRQRSVKQFITRQVEAARKKETGLKKVEEQYRGRDIEAELATLNAEFDQLRRDQIELNATGRTITTKIKEIDENVAAFAVDKYQRQELISHLEADLQRLEFLAEASVDPDTLNINMCGYCKQPVDASMNHPSQEQIDVQRTRLEEQLAGARSNLSELDRTMLELTQQRADLVLKHAELQDRIAHTITPRQEQLTREVRTLKEVAGIQARLDEIQETIAALTDLGPQSVEKRAPYKPVEFFNADFIYSMNTTIRQILHEIGFPSADAAVFDETTLDVTIDGYRKDTKEGKGFAALLNTVVMVAFHEYLDQRSPHAPHFLIIDSPLKNFDDSQLTAPYSMRQKLLGYIARMTTNRQVILCENLNLLSGVDLDALPNTTTIRFSKNPYQGRYGYLDGVYEPGEHPHE